jgi:hypothetical protein
MHSGIDIIFNGEMAKFDSNKWPKNRRKERGTTDVHFHQYLKEAVGVSKRDM